MQPDAARNLINDAFEHAYDEMQMRRFVQNLLVDVNTKTGGHRSGQMVYESFREHVASYKRLAKYTDPDGEEMDVFGGEAEDAPQAGTGPHHAAQLCGHLSEGP